ncbi:MAG TPA: phasin family protein [Acidimicrobiales bacterium]|jgi:polyhydroxyalkanoate synthesis regulator phasin|nr:phasin family protein [Acidimicrobiales bacterium]
MPQSDLWKRYLDAGMEFSQLTRSRAESIVKELIRAGEVQREQRQQRIEDLLDRSRKNTEELVKTVRKELSQQLGTLGVATKADLAKLEAKIDRLAKSGGAAKKAAPKAAAAKKA